MKLLFIALTTIASFFATTSQASEKISPVVLQSFERSFSTATETKWTVSENFYKANFFLNDQNITAFYSEEGELVALTRNITSQQLPIVLQSNLRKDYGDYWISELFEVANDSGSVYYVTLEDADSKVILKSGSSSWSTYKKIQKS